jgi:uncharacterized protein
MELDDSQELDLSQIDDQRGRGGGGMGGGGIGMGGGGMGGGMGGLPIGRAGGGLGLVVMIIIFALTQCNKSGGGGGGLPIDPGSANFGGNNVNNAAPAGGDNSNLAESCKVGTDRLKRQDCRNAVFVNSIQGFWKAMYPRWTDRPYQVVETNFFSGRVQTGCGAASSAVGPFYCPADSQVYVDLDFFAELQSKFGAKGGPFAEAYVIAHEYGHHIQNLTGQSEKVQRSGDESGPTSGAVRLELQADCYAGVWARNATSGPRPLIKSLTESDIREGLDAASAVGDDRIQEKMQGRVTPESWTHGSSEQRQKWFLTGFQSGEPTSCDTFNTRNL